MLIRSAAVRGFTILELAISMAIAGIVVAAASTAAVNVTRVLKLEAKKSIADQDARRLVDFVVGRLQGAGGGPVRPWMAIWHEENCPSRNGLPACQNQDRLTIVDVDKFRGPCQVLSINGSSVSFVRPAPDPATPTVQKPCCYEWPSSAVDIDPDEPNQFHQQPVMIANGRDHWTMVTITEETDEGSCTMGIGSARPLAAWNETVDPADYATLLKDGLAVGAAPRTLYLDNELRAAGAEAPPAAEDSPRQLVEWFDTNYNTNLDDNEARVVFPGVYDFQIALGYDAEPEDGRVIETAAGVDEWWGNRAETGALTMPLSTLRMGTVGVVVGVKAVDPGTRTAQVLNGPSITRSHHLTRTAVGKAMLRNISVFY